MKATVLIDSSVWVAVSRKGGDARLKDEVGSLLETGRAAMSWPVWVELHQGAKGRREEESLKGWRDLSVWLAFDDACWRQAALTARSCLRAGINVPFGDVLVHACAARHGVELLECDRHFAMIRTALGK
ncbi:MAG: PIN domain-containing protein [Verrucomicrobiota bacterium]